MRVANRRGSGSDNPLGDVPINMENLLREALEEGEGGVVERLAERIAKGRRPTGRPSALKRHDTA